MMLSTSLLIDDQMCFALYAASRSVTAVYRPLLESLGLTYPQYLVMLVLWREEAVTIKQISNVLRLDYGTLTPLLKRLEALGYLRRQRRVSDERTVEVTVTEAGAALREKAAGIPAEISRALGLDADRTAALRDLLRAVSTNTARYLDTSYPD